MDLLDYMAERQRQDAAGSPVAARDLILAGLQASGPGTGPIGGPYGNGIFPPSTLARAGVGAEPARSPRPASAATPQPPRPRPRVTGAIDPFGPTWGGRR
jgi:hypothetical protein